MKIENQKYRLLFISVPVILLLDQWSKFWIHRSMELHQSIPVIPKFFNLTYIRNPGAAFGLFSESGGMLRTFAFIGISLIALVVLGYLYSKTLDRNRLLRLALSLVTGGAIGNLIDRVRMGEVIDFLDFYIGSSHWPAFNVADSCISVGVFLILLQGWVTPRDRSEIVPNQ